MAFTAKYPGKCVVCGLRFPAGTQINWAGNKTAAHEACGVPEAAEDYVPAEKPDPAAAAWAAFQASYVPEPGEGENPFL